MGHGRSQFITYSHANIRPCICLKSRQINWSVYSSMIIIWNRLQLLSPVPSTRITSSVDTATLNDQPTNLAAMSPQIGTGFTSCNIKYTVNGVAGWRVSGMTVGQWFFQTWRPTRYPVLPRVLHDKPFEAYQQSQMLHLFPQSGNPRLESRVTHLISIFYLQQCVKWRHNEEVFLIVHRHISYKKISDVFPWNLVGLLGNPQHTFLVRSGQL